MTTKKPLRNESNIWREQFDKGTKTVVESIKEFFSIRDYEGFEKQLNKGKIAELFCQYKLQIKTPVFDKINDYDFIYQGKRIQFKYIGQNSSPSITEIRKEKNETHLKFVNRVMRYYSHCDVFMISLENRIANINKNNLHVLIPKDFKKILMLHEVKDGNKLRLRKIITRNYIRDMK